MASVDSHIAYIHTHILDSTTKGVSDIPETDEYRIIFGCTDRLVTDIHSDGWDHKKIRDTLFVVKGELGVARPCAAQSINRADVIGIMTNALKSVRGKLSFTDLIGYLCDIYDHKERG